MFKKFSIPTTVAIVATLTFGALAKAETPTEQKASPTPTAKPQNQSIINTTKSNTKDLTAPVPAATPKRPRDRAAEEVYSRRYSSAAPKDKKRSTAPAPTATVTPAGKK